MTQEPQTTKNGGIAWVVVLKERSLRPAPCWQVSFPARLLYTSDSTFSPFLTQSTQLTGS